MMHKKALSWLLTLCMLIFLTLSLLQLRDWVERGYPLQTDVTQLLPVSDMDDVSAKMYDYLLNQASSRLIIMLEGMNVDNLTDAAIELQNQLDLTPGIEHIDSRPDVDRFRELASSLIPYRNSLVSKDDRLQLTEDPVTAVDHWMNDDPFVRPLTLSNDPLGTLGRFLQEVFGSRGNIESDGFFYWIADDSDSTPAIIIFADLEEQSLGSDKSDRLSTDLYAIFDRIQNDYNVVATASSVLFHASASKQQARFESGIFGSVSAILILALLLVAFRSLVPVLKTLAIISIALLCGFAVADYLFSELHVIALLMAIPVIGVGADYLIHSEVHKRSRVYAVKMDEGLSPYMIRALSWGCLSTTLGYAALGLVKVAVLQQVAVVLIVGLLTIFAGVVCLGSIIPEKIDENHIGRIANSRVIRLLENRPMLLMTRTTISIIFALSIIVLIIFNNTYSAQIFVDDNPASLHHVDDVLAARDMRIQQRLDISGHRYSLVVDADNVNQLLRRQEKLVDDLQDKFGVKSYGLSSLVPSHQRQHQNWQLIASAYASLSSVDLKILQSEGVTISDSRSGTDMDPEDLPAEYEALLPPFDISQHDNYPVWSAVFLSHDVDWLALGKWCNEQAGCRLIDSIGSLGKVLSSTHRSMRTALQAALLIVALVFLLRYRSRGILAGLALTLVVLGAITIPRSLGFPLTLFGTGGLFVLLGLSVDYLVFVLESQDHRKYIWVAFILSAATTLLAFGMLLFSITPAVKMLATPIVVGLPIMLFLVFIIQSIIAKPGSSPSSAEQKDEDSYGM
ncbi:MAG: MMPL family efflux pump permease component [marine bacterium B5-7]|nr:MAG: MMPL family efflux pump permease component [marine bacterium B5-7]